MASAEIQVSLKSSKVVHKNVLHPIQKGLIIELVNFGKNVQFMLTNFFLSVFFHALIFFLSMEFRAIFVIYDLCYNHTQLFSSK